MEKLVLLSKEAVLVTLGIRVNFRKLTLIEMLQTKFQ